MGDVEQHTAPLLVALDGKWPPLYLPRDVPEWNLRAQDQLLVHAARMPVQGDLVVVREAAGREYLTRFPAAKEHQILGVVVSVMRLRP